MTTFVTVVFPAELFMLKLQAKSLARYLGRGFCARLIVITNDCTPDTVDRADYGPLADLVEIFDGARLSPYVGTSYVNQQALKLAIARHIGDEWFVVLDAKNFLIKPYDPGHLFAPSGQPYLVMRKHACNDYGWRAQRYYSRLLVLPPCDLTIQIHTPFVMHTVTALGLIDTHPLASLANHRPPSEFMLYYTYLRKLNKTRMYQQAMKEPALVVRGHDAHKIAQLTTTQRPFAGVHRKFYELASVSERATLNTFLIERGLCDQGA